ncbi:MAG: hypothetical protein ACFE0I_20955 [Elainellaceae cyanobacterium]
MRQGKIEYTKAQAIARLKNPQQREKVLEEAIANQLSLKQIKQRLHQAQTKRHPEKIDNSLEVRWMKAYSQLKKTNLWAESDERAQLERIVVELESLLLSHNASLDRTAIDR